MLNNCLKQGVFFSGTLHHHRGIDTQGSQEFIRNFLFRQFDMDEIEVIAHV